MCKKLFMLWMIVFPNLQVFNANKVFNPRRYPSEIVIESRIPNYSSIGYCWGFNILQKKVTWVRKKLWTLHKHFDMNVRTKQCLGLGVYVVAIWSGLQIGLHLRNFGKRLYSFYEELLFVSEMFQSKMQSTTTCTIGWTWRPLMLLCGSLFMGL